MPTPAIALLGLLAVGHTTEIKLLPLKGGALPQDRAKGTSILSSALAGIEGVHVISLANVSEMFGPDAQAAIDRCADDPCLAQATSMVRSDALVAGTFDAEAGRMIVRLRLIDTSTHAFGRTLVRVVREVPEGAGQGGFAGAISSAAAELLPELAEKSFGMLALKNGRAGASIYVDGALTDEFGDNAKGEALLRLRAGNHEIKVTAQGHAPFSRSIDVLVGQRTDVEVDLSKNHSVKPFVLAGIGGAAAIVGGVLVLSAHGIVRDWENGCNAQHCMPGFTRDRYDSDNQTLDRDRLSAGGLFIVASGAVAAAIVWYLLDPGADE
jgi:hypothetical protein